METKNVTVLDGPAKNKVLTLKKETTKFKHIMLGHDDDFVYNVDGEFATLEKEDI